MYRVAVLLALLCVVVLLFTLGRPETPKLSDAFVSFDGSSAAEQMRTIVTDFPQRTAGSDADNRCGYWVFEQFQQLQQLQPF